MGMSKIKIHTARAESVGISRRGSSDSGPRAAHLGKGRRSNTTRTTESSRRIVFQTVYSSPCPSLSTYPSPKSSSLAWRPARGSHCETSAMTGTSPS